MKTRAETLAFHNKYPEITILQGNEAIEQVVWGTSRRSIKTQGRCLEV